MDNHVPPTANKSRDTWCQQRSFYHLFKVVRMARRQHARLSQGECLGGAVWSSGPFEILRSWGKYACAPPENNTRAAHRTELRDSDSGCARETSGNNTERHVRSLLPLSIPPIYQQQQLSSCCCVLSAAAPFHIHTPPGDPLQLPDTSAVPSRLLMSSPREAMIPELWE